MILKKWRPVISMNHFMSLKQRSADVMKRTRKLDKKIFDANIFTKIVKSFYSKIWIFCARMPQHICEKAHLSLLKSFLTAHFYIGFLTQWMFDLKTPPRVYNVYYLIFLPQRYFFKSSCVARRRNCTPTRYMLRRNTASIMKVLIWYTTKANWT